MFFTELFFQLISSKYIIFNWFAFDTLGLMYLSFIIKILIYGIKKIFYKRITILSFEIFFSTFSIILIGLILYYLYSNTEQKFYYVKYFSVFLTSIVIVWSIHKELKNTDNINKFKILSRKNNKKTKVSKQNNTLSKQKFKSIKLSRKQSSKKYDNSELNG